VTLLCAVLRDAVITVGLRDGKMTELCRGREFLAVTWPCRCFSHACY